MNSTQGLCKRRICGIIKIGFIIIVVEQGVECMNNKVAVNPMYRNNPLINGNGRHPCGKFSGRSEYFRDPKNNKLVCIETDSKSSFIVSITTSRTVKQKTFTRKQLQQMVTDAEKACSKMVTITIDQVPGDIQVFRVQRILESKK